MREKTFQRRVSLKQKVIGFEFEIGSPWSMATTVRKIREELGIKGLKAQVDVTVDTPQKYNGEIATPPWPYRQGVVNLKKIFKWFEKNGIVTNDSCGFHVNISFKNKELNWMMDTQRLILCFNEEKWLKVCKRHGSEWTECYIDELILIAGRKKFKDEDGVKKWIDKQLEDLTEERQHTINLNNLGGKNPYVEYRCLGGVGYHLRYNVMIKAITDMAKNLERALPNSKGTGFMTTKVKECFLPQTSSLIPH